MSLNIVGQNLEDKYLSDTKFPIIKNNYVVISGCSGGGKSTLLSELASRGYLTIAEPGRQIVKEQTAINGNGCPRINLEKFLDLALSRYLLQFNSQIEQQQLVFFDRSIIDSVQLSASQPEYFQNAAQKFRYNHIVFLVPPWEEIFLNDPERTHSFVSAKKEFEELLVKYKSFGYETVLVPKVSIKDRADFILQKLGPSTNQVNKSDLYIAKAKHLLDWNKIKLTSYSDLKIDDIKALFAPKFIVMANGRKYDANYQNYYDFLNKFRSDIATIDYEVQEYLNVGSTVVISLKAIVKRLQGKTEIFEAIMVIKFNDAGKIVHWQEVYTQVN